MATIRGEYNRFSIMTNTIQNGKAMAWSSNLGEQCAFVFVPHWDWTHEPNCLT